MTYPLVIASAAKQSRATLATLDCFVASPLAMTAHSAPTIVPSTVPNPTR